MIITLGVWVSWASLFSHIPGKITSAHNDGHCPWMMPFELDEHFCHVRIRVPGKCNPYILTSFVEMTISNTYFGAFCVVLALDFALRRQYCKETI